MENSAVGTERVDLNLLESSLSCSPLCALQELRALTHWSDGHMWVSPEMHGTITGVFKNQIDWSEYIASFVVYRT